MTTQPQSYSTIFSVDRPAQEVFDAINNVAGWWSKQVVGVTDRVGGEFDYHYQDAHSCNLRVTELVPGRRVAWHVMDNYFNFVQDQDEAAASRWPGVELRRDGPGHTGVAGIAKDGPRTLLMR